MKEQKIKVLTSPENQFCTYVVTRSDFSNANTVDELIHQACVQFGLDRSRVRFRANFWRKMSLHDAVPDGEHEISEVPINRIKVAQLIIKLQCAESNDCANKIVNEIKKIIDPNWMNIHWVNDFFELFINSCDSYANSIDSETIEDEDTSKIDYYLHLLKNTIRVD